MNAMILCAGFGTRLRPHTNHWPKSLFKIDNQPIIDIIIRKMIDSGIDTICINTHHLADEIKDFISNQHYPVRVDICHEPEILGTGGGIRNMFDYWLQNLPEKLNQPFFVFNSDILTDIDLQDVYSFHNANNAKVTLVMHDYPEFNTVKVENNRVFRFDKKVDQGLMAFTGIHIIDPSIVSGIEPKKNSTIIELYNRLISQNEAIHAYIAKNHYWHDIGTFSGFKNAACRVMSSKVFQGFFPNRKLSNNTLEINDTKLKGDGSDRSWHRLTANVDDKYTCSVILADHGIRPMQETVCEADAFVSIGKHLHSKGLPVPNIIYDDKFSGLVFLEDLGDTHLQTLVNQNKDSKLILSYYKNIIDILVDFSIKGFEGFDTSWTYQTAKYDREMIINKESRYFIEAFLNGYIGTKIRFEDLSDEFERLATTTVLLTSETVGLMHRDFQSRNIMYNKGRFFIIDFQGARLGPIQYDLASLLIDPYVSLPHYMQILLLRYCFETLTYKKGYKIDPLLYDTGYRYCALHRNLQMLGAFGFLSKVKGKTEFEQYIPKAKQMLKSSVLTDSFADLPKFQTLVSSLL